MRIIEMYHKCIPLRLRYKLYWIPYMIYMRRFFHNIDIDNMPLFSYVEIETVNRCNGDCPFCPVNVNQPQRPYAKMTDELFKKIIDELSEMDYSGKISLFSNNEPFLDQRITEFAKYTREKCPKASISILTNGLILNLEKVKGIIEYVDILVIDNYSDDNKLHDNLIPVQAWSNSDEKYHERIRIEMRKKNEVLTTRGGESPNAVVKKNSFINRIGCQYPYKQMVIRPSGGVSLCCNDALGKYTMGDVNDSTLKEIWYSDKYRKIREKMITTQRKDLMLCNVCDVHNLD